MGNINTLKLTKIFKKLFFNGDENCYSHKLKIPYFLNTFQSNQNFNDILEKIQSTYDGSVIKKGQIIKYNYKTMELTNQLPCYILCWNRDSRKFSFGLGFYIGNGFIMTAKHNLKNNNKVFVIFPTKKFSLVYNINPLKIRFENKDDIAIIQFESNCDKLPNIKPIEIGELSGNNFFFYELKSGHFKKKMCEKIKPNPRTKMLMLPKELAFFKAGNHGDSGSPCLSSSGKCFGIYVARIEKSKNSPQSHEFGIVLQFDRNLIKKISLMTQNLITSF